MTKSVIIADDHLLFLKGMEELFSRIDNIEILAVINDGFQVVPQVESLHPEVLMLDLNFKTTNGFIILQEINKLKCKPLVVFISMYDDLSIVNKARELGASGYFLKETDPDELIQGILTLKRNEFKVSKSLNAGMADENISMNVHFQDSFVADIVLTTREIDILKLIARGKTAREIAEELFISSNTVDTHRKNIQKKLKLNKISELVKYAISKKII